MFPATVMFFEGKDAPRHVCQHISKGFCQTILEISIFEYNFKKNYVF